MTEIQQKIKDLRCCVIIPTYNNEKTLERVIRGVLRYTEDVIIVNDGATDSTPHILARFPQTEQIHFPANRGKGPALRAGFRRAEDLGFTYAVTIDSDGQHFPDDIPVFIHTLDAAEDKNLLLIGDRNMERAGKGIPSGSSSGNRHSSFWYGVETGVQLQDTQSGFRLYPLRAVNQSKYFSGRFEFETEVIVKAAWNGVNVQNVPIDVLYDPDERVTHFRPYADYIRIVLLNIAFVFWAFLYIKPRDMFRNIRRKGFKQFFFEDFLRSSDSKEIKSLSVALGVFIGIAPFWGAQSVLAVGLAAYFGLNKVLSFTFSNVSLPIFIPFIIYASLWTGALVTGEDIQIPWITPDESFAFGKHLWHYLLGSFIFAGFAATVFGLAGYTILSIFEKK